MKQLKWSNLYLTLVFIFLYLPIAYLIFYSFNAGDSMSSFKGFSLVHFQELFGDTRLIIILLNTFMLAFLSALIATVIGIFGAMSIYYLKKRAAKTAMLLDFLYLFRQSFLWLWPWFYHGTVIAHCLQYPDCSLDGLAKITGNEWLNDFSCLWLGG